MKWGNILGLAIVANMFDRPRERTVTKTVYVDKSAPKKAKVKTTVRTKRPTSFFG